MKSQQNSQSKTQKEIIAVYVDDGASVGKIIRSLAREIDPDYIIRPILATHLDLPNFFNEIALFIMPGGADVPYCRKLNGERNKKLKHWVHNGGTYLGICAGAYYACSEVKFHVGRTDEISGKRELAFLNAAAIGSLPEITNLYDITLKSAAVAKLRLSDNQTAEAFYHGGPAFELHDEKNIDILARYEKVPGNPPAIIETHFGKGHVLLTGVHAEVSVTDLLPDVLATGNRQQFSTLLTDLQHAEKPRRTLWRSMLTKVGLVLVAS